MIRFESHFQIAPGIESLENRTCSVGNSVVIFLHFKKIAFKVFIGLLKPLFLFFLFATNFTKLLTVFFCLSQQHDDVGIIAPPPFITKFL
jgi:hypothetical protein